MRDLCRLIGWMVVDLIRSRVMLEAEIWTLRQQINVLRRTAPKKLTFCAVDRMIFVGLYRLFPKICDALAIVKPDTLVRWHRAGFRSYWRWKSRRRGGRPKAGAARDGDNAAGAFSSADDLGGKSQLMAALLFFTRTRGGARLSAPPNRRSYF
jgi:hypothetical protein